MECGYYARTAHEGFLKMGSPPDHKFQYKTGWWFGTLLLFFHIFAAIIPIDFHIFQWGGSTTNQKNHPMLETVKCVPGTVMLFEINLLYT